MSFLKWTFGTIVVFVAFCLFVGWAGSRDSGSPSKASSPDASREFDAAFAFGACEKAIKLVAKNPSAAVIPNRPNIAESGGFLFDWKHGDGLRLQNGFGAKLDTTATCVVAEDKVTVMALIVDGKKLIYRKPK